MEAVLEQIRMELQHHADDATRQSGQRFFKEEVHILGVKSKQVAEIARKLYKVIAGAGKEEIFALCEALWQTGYMEESMIACRWSEMLKKEYVPTDFRIFESWLNMYVTNWATCDTFCNHTVGALIMKYPDCLGGLKQWTTSGNRWVRRGSAVSLIIPARKGLFLDSAFEIADALLTDVDDMVQKGYGWLLKVASQTFPDEVYQFIMERQTVMPRTALRYAIEKLPAEMKKMAMHRP